MTPRTSHGRARDGAEQLDWQDRLTERLQSFVAHWKGYGGTEQAGAQSFLQKLLDIYEVTAEAGTVFEQHPVRMPVKAKKAQRSLFADEEPQVAYETTRMDMYLPRVCVWEMKGPGETDLQVHHDQLLGYWARMRPRYMVLCNFHEFWIYAEDTELIPANMFTDTMRRAHEAGNLQPLWQLFDDFSSATPTPPSSRRSRSRSRRTAATTRARCRRPQPPSGWPRRPRRSRSCGARRAAGGDSGSPRSTTCSRLARTPG